MNRAEIVEKYRKYLYGVTTYYKEPLPFVRGEGKWLQDADGRRYLDFFGGIVTVALGHCEPRVVAALEKQARTLQHVSTLFPTIPIGELAEKLAEIFPGDKPAKCFFTNSGTPGGEAQLPFGGTKATGVGPREQGPTALEFYTEVKTVYVDYTGQARKSSIY